MRDIISYTFGFEELVIFAGAYPQAQLTAEFTYDIPLWIKHVSLSGNIAVAHTTQPSGVALAMNVSGIPLNGFTRITEGNSVVGVLTARQNTTAGIDLPSQKSIGFTLDFPGRFIYLPAGQKIGLLSWGDSSLIGPNDIYQSVFATIQAVTKDPNLE